MGTHLATTEGLFCTNVCVKLSLSTDQLLGAGSPFIPQPGPSGLGGVQWQADVRPGGSTEGEFASPSFVEEATPHPRRRLSVLEFSGRGVVPRTARVVGASDGL